MLRENFTVMVATLSRAGMAGGLVEGGLVVFHTSVLAYQLSLVCNVTL